MGGGLIYRPISFKFVIEWNQVRLNHVYVNGYLNFLTQKNFIFEKNIFFTH